MDNWAALFEKLRFPRPCVPGAVSPRSRLLDYFFPGKQLDYFFPGKQLELRKGLELPAVRRPWRGH